MTAALLQAFGGLAVLVALMFAAAWVFRRSGGVQALARGPVKVVGGVSVGTRERVVLLEGAETWVLVGVAPGQVQALHTLPRQELPGGDSTPMLGAPFQQLIARFAARPAGDRPA